MTAGLFFSDMLIPVTLGVKIYCRLITGAKKRKKLFANELAKTLATARNECLFAQFWLFT